MDRQAPASEQLEDECQLWGRALKIVQASQTAPTPRDQVFWKATGPSSKSVCMSVSLSRFVRTSLLKAFDELEERRAALDRMKEGERHLQADLRYAQEKMELYRAEAASVQSGGDSARLSSRSCQDSALDVLVSERQQELLNSKSIANSRAKALQAKVETQEVEIQRLRKKLGELEHSEAEKHQRQQEIFRSFRNRKPTKHSPLDNKMLDIIDRYEAELQRLRHQQQTGATDYQTVEDVGDDHGYREIIDELNQQVASFTEQLQRVEDEKELLATELEARPTNSDHVLLMSKLSRYERLLKRHSIDPSKEQAPTSAKEFSTSIDDLEMLPLSQCQKFLKEAAALLGVEDLKELKEAIGDLSSISDAYGVVHPVIAEAEKLTLDEGGPGIPAAILQQHGPDKLQCLLPVIDHWRQQLLLLPELQRSLQRLFNRLYPWASSEKVAAHPDVRQLIVTVDRMSSDDNFELADGADAKSGDKSQAEPPHAMLLGIVDHFKKLFDIRATSAVFTKMNSVYSELGCCRNAFNSLRDVLGMDTHCQIEAVVQAVTKLHNLERQSLNSKLEEIFSQEDVQAALEKLEEYEQFFPVFEDLVKNLMAVLDVTRVDEILPAVASYKRVVDAETLKHL